MLSALRKLPEPKLSKELDWLVSKYTEMGLKPEVVAGVRQVVQERWQKSFAGKSPGLLVPVADFQQRRKEPAAETANLRQEIKTEGCNAALPLLDQYQRLNSDRYLKLAQQFYEVWVRVMLMAAPDETERARMLQQEFDSVEQQAVKRYMVPAAVQAVRRIAEARLKPVK